MSLEDNEQRMMQGMLAEMPKAKWSREQSLLIGFFRNCQVLIIADLCLECESRKVCQMS